ncbi:16S rRNA (cytidine(1402)-2'-O)-methyltransferase [uncultured Gulosibacter sp.]|uniref:16S rRNA (cytidine(1402)-2'-O)-methyltransferase n=1 Tax=uncultured Gulosibacter sp. TaxID=1339167 RepID=UPI00288C0A81|nr:16S rRNA (cytidine(1402)-2'-O)-methyltransferase [uncultured Gulosibacter sp.]
MLILVGTPLGNLADASQRMRETLARVAVIACEDTRTTAKLLQLLDVHSLRDADSRPSLIALHDHNESELAADIARLALEQDVALVSDAGMPGISDPGYPVVVACAEAGVTVTSVPGPTAVATALAISGLATDRFCFDGFVPRKAGERARLIAELDREPRTIVLYESPHRLAATLAEFAASWPGRRAAVCRELTKLHEEVRRGTLRELADWAVAGVRGEVVIVLAGAKPEDVSLEAAAARTLELALSGMRLKDAAAEVAAATGLSKRELYQAALVQRDT